MQIALAQVTTQFLLPDLICIPAGSFWMGQPGSARRVTTNAYAIGKYPVTNAEYVKATQAGAVRPPSIWGGSHPPADRLDHPVVNIGWEDAAAYIGWFNDVSGTGYRLPTETEWERAARGDSDHRLYTWGDAFEPSYLNSRERAILHTTAVTAHAHAASPWGCCDMLGNVWEWTSDFYDVNHPPTVPDGIPIPDNFLRVLRGGGAYAWAQPCHARASWWPRYMFSGHVGFRLAVDC